MHFRLEHRIAADPDAVARAYTDPALYPALAGLPKLGGAEVVSREELGEEVELRVRYRFTGHLSPAVTAVVDPGKLTWVEVARHDLANRRVTFRLEPDNYADRLSCAGEYRFEEAGGATVRRTEGELKVRALLVGKAVEGAIVSGLDEHLTAEGPAVAAWLAEHGAG
jgi:hypothetical protein